MDPDANLRELRELTRELVDPDGQGFTEGDEPNECAVWEHVEKAARLAALCEALDGWISKGGFLPKAWDRK